MKPWHWMIIGIVVWLFLGVLGLRWVLWPYWWASVPTLSVPKNLQAAREEFPIHIASFRESNATASSTSDESEEGMDPATMSWIGRETTARFAIGFTLWMFSGWFVHWFMGRIVRPPRRRPQPAQ